MVLQAERPAPSQRADPVAPMAMGYQPSLDGIRALAVVAVLLYHADLRWIPGGFLGVDVFFVVSGYLITSLLIEERRGSMSTDLKHFWLRRAKRLLPALFAMVVVTCVYAAAFVPDALYRLRTDVLAAATYSTNWWLIASHQSYFEALGRPPLLRHLWSLAVEEQWYLLWPLVFVVLMGLVRGRAERLFVPVLLAALASTVWMAIVFDPSADASRAYFATDTRASGPAPRRGDGHGLDAVAVATRRSMAPPGPGRRRLGGPRAAGVRDAALGRGLRGPLPGWVPAGVGADHRRGRGLRASRSGHPPRRARRSPRCDGWARGSYGLYLWHWPVFMVTRHQDYPWMDDRMRFALQVAITFALTELSFRLVERPVRDGSAMRHIDRWRADHELRARARGWLTVGGVAALLCVGLVGTRVATADQIDVATGGKDVAFDQPSDALASLAPTAAAGGAGDGRRPRWARSPPACPAVSQSSATPRPTRW